MSHRSRMQTRHGWNPNGLDPIRHNEMRAQRAQFRRFMKATRRMTLSFRRLARVAAALSKAGQSL